MRHIFLMVTFFCVCNSGYAKSVNKKKPTREEAILVMTKQVSMTAMLELTKSGTSIEDHKFLVDVYKKANISLDSKVPYTLNDKKELMINGKVVSFKNKNVFYKNHMIVYNQNKSLSSNVKKFAQQIRSKSSVSFWPSLFIEEAAAQDSKYDLIDEDYAEAGALAMALKHIYNYVEVESADAYRLKAGMGTDPMINSAIAGSKRTIQGVSCKDMNDETFRAGKYGSMHITYKDGGRLEFQKMWSKDDNDFIYRIVTYSASGDMRQGTPVVGSNNPMAEVIENFCNSPENVQAEYVQGLQDIQLRNADGGGTVLQ